MNEYYLIPKEDIEELEKARKALHDLIKNIDIAFRYDMNFKVTSKIYNITHKKHKKIIMEE